jgi:hypothetical protein
LQILVWFADCALLIWFSALSAAAAMFAVPVGALHGDVDLAAATLQLKELQKKYQDLQDAQLAMQLFLEDLDGDAALLQDQPSSESFELGMLQEQMNNLSAAIIAAEDERAALGILDAEEASQAASLQLADALTAQEQYDATVLRPHDGALARQIAGCDQWEWEQRGEWIKDPLDISDRPVEPVIPVGGLFVAVWLRCGAFICLDHKLHPCCICFP